MSFTRPAAAGHIRQAVVTAAVSLMCGLVTTPASAGPIALDTWYEFSFTAPGTPARGCDPADPLGDFCFASSGTPTTELGAPPWTFTGAAKLTVTDAFTSGDRFQVFDFGASIGLTSGFTANVDCGDDPVPCLANPGMSHGTFFLLGAGNHSITITPTAGGFGAAYLRAEVRQGADVPEPATLILVGAGLAAGLRRVRTRR